MKIIFHIVTQLELGGAQLNTLYTTGYIAKKGYKTYLLSRDGYLSNKIPDGVFYIPLKYLDRKIRIFKDILAYFEIRKYIRKYKPDIIHTHSSKAGIIGRLFKLFYPDIFFIHTVHGWSFNNHNNPFLNRIYIIAEKLVNSFTDLYITVTDNDIQKGIQNGIGEKDKYLTIRSGIVFDEFIRVRDNLSISTAKKFLGIEPAKTVVGTIACFKPQKGIFNIIEIANIIVNKNRIKNIVFVIVGDGELRSRIEKRIAKYQLSHFVKLLGWREDVPKIMKSFDIFLLTSFWEGLPQSLLQSILMKIPVVVSNIDGNKEIVEVGKTGILVKPDDINGFVSTIKEFISKGVMWNNIINYYKKYNLPIEFSVDIMLMYLLDLYGSVSARKVKVK